MHNHWKDDDEALLFTVQDDLPNDKKSGDHDLNNDDTVYEMLISDSGYLLILGAGLVITLLITLLLLLKKKVNFIDDHDSGGGSGEIVRGQEECYNCPNVRGRGSYMTNYFYGNKTALDSKCANHIANFDTNNSDNNSSIKSSTLTSTKKGKSSSTIDTSEVCSSERDNYDNNNNVERNKYEQKYGDTTSGIGDEEFVSTRSSEVIQSRWRNSFYRACRLNYSSDRKRATDDILASVEVVDSDNIEEPEFLKSRTLRSTDVQMSLRCHSEHGKYPLIFGRSKDSVILPPTTILQQQSNNNQQHQQQQQLSTTRILTDENGHSIKIRVATPKCQLSPPPPPPQQPQPPSYDQLYNDNYSHCKSHNSTQKLGTILSDDDVSLKTINDEADNESMIDAHTTPASVITSSQHSTLVNGISSNNNNNDNNSRSELNMENNKSTSQSRNKLCHRRHSEAIVSSLIEEDDKSSTPIETFNDSNTSEYDDTWCDSRQEDTSTFDNSQQSTNNENANIALDTGDSVLDADLRKANRLNVEMAMMMNQSRNIQALESGLILRDSSTVGRSSRSRSLTSAFSQTGVLPAVSLVEAEQQQQMNMLRQQQKDLDFSQNNRSLTRASISSDQGSSDSMVTESLYSSIIRHPISYDQHLATLRIAVRRLIVKTTTETSDNSDIDNRLSKNQSENPIATIKDKLAKFAASRSRSTTSSKDSPDIESEATAPSYYYEVELVESSNLGQQNRSTNSPNNRTTLNNNEPPPKSTGRRDSLMNVLMPSSVHRRSSVDGVFARVFKSQKSVLVQQQQQSNIENTAPETKKIFSPTQSVDSDAYSLTSASTSISILDLGCGSDYIQSPVIRQQNGRVVFEPNSMRLICHEHEFPLRVSLYQVDKKGARYTLGHCFVSLEDWEADFADGKTRNSYSSESSDTQSMEEGRDFQSDEQIVSSRSSISDDLRRRSSSFGLNGDSAGETVQKIRCTMVERPSPDVRLIDFKLYQTIFDAIK